MEKLKETLVASLVNESENGKLRRVLQATGLAVDKSPIVITKVTQNKEKLSIFLDLSKITSDFSSKI